MPFYFRVPLPGPFGYSQRIGGKKRRRTAQRQPAHGRRPYSVTFSAAGEKAPPRRSYTASFGDWECSHSHTTEREAHRCGAERKLWEVEQIEQQLMDIDMSEADGEEQRMFIDQAQDMAARKREARAELEALS